MAQNDKFKKDDQNVANEENAASAQNTAKKGNIFARGWNWTKVHKRDLLLGGAFVMSVANTVVLILANCSGIEAEIEQDAVDSTSESMDIGLE